MSDKRETYVRIVETPYAGRTVWSYQVGCARTGRPIASGWCESEVLAQKMAEKMTPKNDR